MNQRRSLLSRVPVVAAAGVLLVGVAIATGATAAATTATTALPPSSGAVVVTESADDHDAGSFARSATTITYETSAASEVRAKTTISVGGKTFSATKDIAEGTAEWSGGGAVLLPDDRKALTAFGRALNAEWVEPAAVAKKAIPLHRDLTVRMVMLLAEAPVGVAIGSHTVSETARHGERKLPAGTSLVDSCLEEGIATTDPGSAERRAVVAQCQESNEDGILYTGCNENAALCHDADSHCFMCESVFVGPNSSGCMGKCGGGCFVITGYTYDCGDHDRCGRVHGGSTNPWDSECGDEYWEADDDFLLSSDQCD